MFDFIWYPEFICTETRTPVDNRIDHLTIYEEVINGIFIVLIMGVIMILFTIKYLNTSNTLY